MKISESDFIYIVVAIVTFWVSIWRIFSHGETEYLFVTGLSTLLLFSTVIIIQKEVKNGRTKAKANA